MVAGTLGFRWRKVRAQMPANRHVLNVPRLTEALEKGDREFTKTKLEEFGVGDIMNRDVVRGNDGYFEPIGHPVLEAPVYRVPPGLNNTMPETLNVAPTIKVKSADVKAMTRFGKRPPSPSRGAGPSQAPF